MDQVFYEYVGYALHAEFLNSSNSPEKPRSVTSEWSERILVQLNYMVLLSPSTKKCFPTICFNLKGHSHLLMRFLCTLNFCNVLEAIHDDLNGINKPVIIYVM